MKCSDCESQATESRGYINGFGDDLGEDYDHLCDACTIKGLDKFQEDLDRVLAKIQSPEYRLERSRDSYTRAESEGNTEEMISSLGNIARYETQLGNYSVAREEISKAMGLNSDFRCKEAECSLTYRIVIIERAEGNENKAVDAYKHFLNLKRDIKAEPKLRKSRYSFDFVNILMEYGEYLVSFEKYEEAEAILSEAYSEWRYSNLSDKDRDRRVVILIRKGRCLEKMNRRRDQMDAYTDAITIIEDDGESAPSWLIEELSQLAKSEEE